MAYLTTTDYNGFIASAIQPDRGKIDLYFQSLYKEHEQDNKVDFFDRLNSKILDLETQFQLQKVQYIKGKEDMKEIQKGLLSKGESFFKITIDSFENLDWIKIPFHYENGKIWSAEKRNSVQIYEFDIRNLLRGIADFDSYLKSNSSFILKVIRISSLSCFGNLLYKTQHFSKIQHYFGKSIFGHLFLSIFEK